MKIKGFTLAEVLITLTIIGVVAALTLPTLSTSTARSQIGPALAKAINTLENSNRLLLEKNDTVRLSSLCGENYVAGCLRSSLAGGAAVDINYRGTLAFSGDDAVSLVTKDGIAFYQVSGSFNRLSEPTDGLYTVNATSNELYTGRAYIVAVDINGAKNPNAEGQDLFFLYIDNNGTVVPMGGRQARAYRTPELARNPVTGIPLQNQDGTAITYTQPDWEVSGRECNSTTGIVDASNCAGYIVDNGFKVDY